MARNPAADFFRNVDGILNNMQKLAKRLGDTCPTCGRPFLTAPAAAARPARPARDPFPGGRLTAADKQLLDEMVTAGFQVMAKRYHPDVTGQESDRTVQRLKELRDALLKPRPRPAA